MCIIKTIGKFTASEIKFQLSAGVLSLSMLILPRVLLRVIKLFLVVILTNKMKGIFIRSSFHNIKVNTYT